MSPLPSDETTPPVMKMNRAMGANAYAEPRPRDKREGRREGKRTTVQDGGAAYC